MGLAVECPVARAEGIVPPPLQLLYLPGHPGILARVNSNALVHCENVCTGLDVTQNTSILCSFQCFQMGLYRCEIYDDLKK